MERRERNATIVLAGGNGSRMGSGIPKQYLMLGDYPVIWYSLHAFETFEAVTEIVLVAQRDWMDYCRQEIVERYGFTKVSQVVEGGRERYDSVYQGLLAIAPCSHVFVHDGARPFLQREMLERNLEMVRRFGSAVTGMPSKDTVKLADAEGIVQQTPDRSSVWMIQTPQTFAYPLLREAYARLMEERPQGITDDAMVVERMPDLQVHLVEGSYRNIKITTPEDLLLAEALRKDFRG